RRNLVAVAAAGGIAATFNAPVAGVLFALETILGRFEGRYFSSVVIGAVLAHLGWHDLESRVDQIMFFKRLAAAVLMTAAIGTYVWSATASSS
ncbi:MAG: chloride channel protein, partial [Pirellulales bacterium]